jgi:hypothetical protein
MGRKQNTHSADKFCGDKINQHPHSLEYAEIFFRDRTKITGVCPDWCAFPSSYMATLLAGSRDEQAVMNVLNQKAIYHLATAILWWSRAKMIYRFDDALSDTLTAMPLDGKIPFDILDYEKQGTLKMNPRKPRQTNSHVQLRVLIFAAPIGTAFGLASAVVQSENWCCVGCRQSR